MRKTRRALFRIQERSYDEINDAAESAHEVDDCICTTPERLGSYIGHQSDSRTSVSSHNNQNEGEDCDEDACEYLIMSDRVQIIDDRQEKHGADSRYGAEQDEGLSSSHAGIRPVGNRAEEGKKEKREHVVRCHDHAGVGLIQMKCVGQNERDDVVVELPESANR